MGASFHLQAAGIVGAAVLGIWLHLFFGRGWFWRIRSADEEKTSAIAEWPSVVAIVPARNEEAAIAAHGTDPVASQRGLAALAAGQRQRSPRHAFVVQTSRSAVVADGCLPALS